MFSLTDVFTVAEKYRWSRYYFFLRRHARCTARTNRIVRCVRQVLPMSVCTECWSFVRYQFTTALIRGHALFIFFPGPDDDPSIIDSRHGACDIGFSRRVSDGGRRDSGIRMPERQPVYERDVTSPDVTFRKFLEDVRSTLSGATVPPAVFKYPCIFCNDEFSLVPFVRGAGRSRRSLVHFIANRFL